MKNLIDAIETAVLTDPALAEHTDGLTEEDFKAAAKALLARRESAARDELRAAQYRETMAQRSRSRGKPPGPA